MLKRYFKQREGYYLNMEEGYRHLHQCNIKSEPWNREIKNIRIRIHR